MVATYDPKSNDKQELRCHGFEGFDLTRQVLEKGSRTHQFWQFPIETKKVYRAGLYKLDILAH